MGCTRSKAHRLLDVIDNGIDTQTSLQFKITTSKVEEFIDDRPRVPDSFNMDIKNEIDQPKRLEKLPKEEAALPFPYPIHDEDWESAGFLEALGIHFVNSFDVVDKDLQFPSDPNERDSIIQAFLQHKVRKIYDSFAAAEIGLEKYEVWTDKGISLIAFGGAGCHYIRRIKQSNDAEILSHLPDTEFIHDLTFLGKYPVRKPFERYGAAAYFNDKYEVIGIYSCHSDRVFTPECDSNTQQEWEHAKWAWRVTLLTQVTFNDHLLKCHFVEAQSLVIPTRECLPFDHPIRRFLKPHCFRTLYIDHKGLVNLAGPEQLLQRAFAFDYENIIKLMTDLYEQYQFKFLNEFFDGNGMQDVPDEIFPIQNDMKEFWGITHKYVSSYIKVYYPTDDDLCNDKYVALWWKELVGGSIKRSDLCGNLDLETVINVLTQFICNGSVWHQYVGNVQEYLKYPHYFGSKIRPDTAQADIQAYMQVITTGILTGVPMPDLINDWTFVLLKDKHLQDTTNIMSTFQSELLAMSVTVNEKNEKRRMRFKFTDPKVMDVSVGV